MTYKNPWIFRGEVFDSDKIDKYIGFVYIITHLKSGRKYIGRKYFFSFRKPKGKTRKQKAESDWKKYYGSNDDLKALVKKGDECSREILGLYITKGGVNYFEVREQFLRKVLDNDDYFNDNISGHYFKQRVQKYLEEERNL